MRSADPRGNSVSAVQRDDETNLRQDRQVANFHRETIVFAAQQLVQVHQLAALALPTHPHSLARVVNPVAMEEKKRSRSLAGVLFVQLAHQLRAVFDQRIIFGRGFRGIRQVREQREMNVGIVITQESYFQVLHQAADLFLVEQQTGNGHQRSAIVGNTRGKIELGQNLRLQQRGDEVVHQLDGALRTGQKQHQHGEQDELERSVGIGQQQHDRRHEGESEHFGCRQIKLIRMPAQ